MEKISIDTSFLINLLNSKAPFHKEADNFFEEFKKDNFIFYLSTVCLSEYLIKGKIEELPVEILKFDSFNHIQAQIAAEIFRLTRKDLDLKKNIIKFDTQILSQAIQKQSKYLLSADDDFDKILQKYDSFDLKVINISETSPETFFGKLL